MLEATIKVFSLETFNEIIVKQTKLITSDGFRSQSLIVEDSNDDNLIDITFANSGNSTIIIFFLGMVISLIVMKLHFRL